LIRTGHDQQADVIRAKANSYYIRPQALDIFFAKNKDFDRQYTEFGGWKGRSHRGFLPTGETASFIIAGEDITNMVRRCAFIGFTKPR
jgi:hypothetical protein